LPAGHEGLDLVEFARAEVAGLGVALMIELETTLMQFCLETSGRR